MNKFSFISLAMILLFLSGCASTGVLLDDMDESPSNGGSDGDVTALDDDCKPPCTFARSALEDPQSVLAGYQFTQ